MKIRFKSMKSRLVFWFLVLALLPLLTGALITYHQRMQSIKHREAQKLTAVRDLKINQINLWLDERTGDTQTAAEDPVIRDLEKVVNKEKFSQSDIKILESVRNRLNGYLKNYPDYNEIFIINPHTGIIQVSTDRSLEGVNKSTDPYFTEPVKTRRLYIKDIYYSKSTKQPAMALSAPIFGLAHNGKRIVGILVAKVDLEHSLYALLLDRTGMGKTGETLIVNKDTIALNELRWYANAPLNLKIEAEPALLASRGKTGIMEMKDYRGEDVMAAYAYIPRTGWGGVAKQDMKEIYAPVQLMLLQILALLVISAVAVYMLAIFLSGMIARPVLEMTEVSKRIEEGDLSARNHIDTDDELGYLSQAFNSMADTVVSHVSVMRDVTDITETIVDAGEVEDFRRIIIRKLVDITGSDLGAYHLLNRDSGRFEHFTSIGINPELLEPFDASIFEGEFGKTLATKKISHMKDIPEDTVFKFKTFTGTVLPKEIITVPIVIDDVVGAIVSLASINTYSKESLEILDRVLININTAFSNLLANKETKRLADELMDKNQELQLQAEELQSQTEELQQQSEELQEQNVELGIQGEQVEEANRLKSQFLSNMSHELRTPLNSIMALSRVLIMQASQKLSEEEGNYLEIIERNGKQLLALINDILDLSRIEAGGVDVQPKPFSLGSTIEMIMESLRPVAEEKGVEMNCSIPDDFPLFESDEARVYQILQNVIGNAVKFTGEGSVTVSVHSDADKVYVEVADTGIGILETDMPHIFDEFRQVDGTSVRRFDGTGLGLAIACKSAELLAGDLSVESVLGKGSTFTLTLPVAWPGAVPVYEPKAVKAPADMGELPEYMGAKKPEAVNRILLVEDSEAAVIQVRTVLESEGYSVDVARDGREALDYIEHMIPDGIILDLMIPEVDGFEVMEKIRGAKATVKTPVLVLTARDLTPEDMNRLRTDNIHQLIQKGDIDREGLLFRVRSMLGEETRFKTNDEIRNAEFGKRKAKTVAGDSKLESNTILIVEDNPDNMTAIKAVLQDKYNILEAADGEEGLNVTLAERPALVLLDMALPGMDGYTVVRKIRADREISRIPVIALTARAMKGEREESIDAGCDDYIAKPFDPEEALEKIEKWLKKQATRNI